ncbi:hypothetical protein ZEAMMB73_Zm00001d020041 [Zea mays]|uniref:Methyltransferase n=1 Tax=Zea mays TaxID=4577 RepID=A0A1D6I1S1_MAIZE|nr:hypothetical protein ZEAMMB73_Zm00001d020041 [Zea mays]
MAATVTLLHLPLARLSYHLRSIEEESAAEAEAPRSFVLPRLSQPKLSVKEDVPIKWPKSRDVVWKANIPHTHLAKEKSDQNWMVEAGEKIKFPGGGTHFHHGADKYISNIANILNFKDNNINNEGMLRIVLDVGCGVASFGGYLLSSNVIAMSLAPNDVHQNQI